MYDELFLTILLTSVPLILAATGELVCERSGVLNLGVEGMMLMGAVAGLGLYWYQDRPFSEFWLVLLLGPQLLPYLVFLFSGSQLTK